MVTVYICKLECRLTVTQVITNIAECCENQFIDLIIITAKQYIYASKCLQTQLNVSTYIGKLHLEYITESSIAKQSDKLAQFQEKWKTYENAII